MKANTAEQKYVRIKRDVKLRAQTRKKERLLMTAGAGAPPGGKLLTKYVGHCSGTVVLLELDAALQYPMSYHDKK